MTERRDSANVFCPSANLAARIRKRDGRLPPIVRIGELRRPIYEYAPAIYVHEPQPSRLDVFHTAPPLPPVPNAHKLFDTSRVRREAPMPKLWPGLKQAILFGRILAVAFAEKLHVSGDWAGGFLSELTNASVNLGCEVRWKTEHLGKVEEDVGRRYVKWAYGQARSWAGELNLKPPPPDVRGVGETDAASANGKLEALRSWYVQATGWVYTAEALLGLLPAGSQVGPEFRFVQQRRPDTQPRPATEREAPWVERLLPHFVPEFRIRIETHPPPRPLASSGHADTVPFPSPQTLSPDGLAEGSSMLSIEEQIASDYGTRSDTVRIEPALVNNIGQWLSVAVRLGEGTVLVLPECRSAEDKAEVIRLMATELWGPIRRWLRDEPADSPPPPQEPDSRHQPQAGSEDRRFELIPPVTIRFGDKTHTLTPQQFRIMEFMLERESAEETPFVDFVWERGATPRNVVVRSALSKLNSRLLELGIKPRPEFGYKSGHIIKTTIP